LLQEDTARSFDALAGNPVVVISAEKQSPDRCHPLHQPGQAPLSATESQSIYAKAGRDYSAENGFNNVYLK